MWEKAREARAFWFIHMDSMIRFNIQLTNLVLFTVVKSGLSEPMISSCKPNYILTASQAGANAKFCGAETPKPCHNE